ncbi:MAG TPA: EamA family transporter [Candidatus Paceibacterota bacterium]|nr:EamA family transporter [Candidatus Paceibacterota bacterium]
MSWFVYAVLSAFFASLSSILEKRSLERVHSVDFATAIAVITAAITLPVFFLQPLDALTPRVVGLTYLLSLVAALAFVEVTRGVRHMEISASSPLFLLSPLMTALLAYAILGEALTNLQVGGIALLAIGTYILETERMGDLRGFIRHIAGDRYTRLIILGIFLYSLTAIADRVMLSEWGVPATLLVALVQIFIAMNFLLLALWQRGTLKGAEAVLRKEWRILGLVAIFTVCARIANAEATALVAVGLAAAVKRSSTLFTTVIGGEMFRDHGLLRKSIACAIMIAGVAVIAL